MQFFILYISRRRFCERKLLAILFFSTLVPPLSPRFAAVLRTIAGDRDPFLWNLKTRRLAICNNALQPIDSLSRRKYLLSQGWEQSTLVSTSYPRVQNDLVTQLWELQNLDNLCERLKAVRRLLFAEIYKLTSNDFVTAADSCRMIVVLTHLAKM